MRDSSAELAADPPLRASTPTATTAEPAASLPPDYLFEGDLAASDPTLGLVVGLEEERQREKLVLIASESICPPAVRQALGSVFTSIYAEGYPHRRLLGADEPTIADLPRQLAEHRRYGDRRYYKGTELVDAVEALAQRRVAELFAGAGGAGLRPEEVYANVQALSGAAANNAVYAALLEPGDTIMGLDLTHGGHLTHGSPANRSGRYYRVSAYGVDPRTGRLEYDALAATARAVNPKLIVAGGSAFPWEIDWRRLRQIADALPTPALVLADISHPAGLVVAGLFPNPVGLADVVTFTTHKTLIGPRAAVILTTDRVLARRIDRAVFPGEQGGPHVNNVAAMAVAFRTAQTPQFRRLQERIVENARALAAGLTARGLRLAYGGTSTHLLLIDLRSVAGGPGGPADSGVPLNGDLASRILDVAGLVCNKNTIAGDTSPVYPSGLRLGTTWLTQRGLGSAEMDEVADLVQTVLAGIRTFTYNGSRGPLPRGKVEPAALAAARAGVARLAGAAAPADVGRTPDAPRATAGAAPGQPSYLLVRGPRAGAFLQGALAADVLALAPGEARPTAVFGPAARLPARVAVARLAPDADGDRYALAGSDGATALATWLRDLSDGYVLFDPADVYAKVDGPAVVEELSARAAAARGLGASTGAALARALEADSPAVAPAITPEKPYFVGQSDLPPGPAARPEFRFSPPAGPPRQTPLAAEHLRLGARLVPFAGWEMPVWYAGIAEEHRAVRTAAGLFDLAHMGVLEITGAAGPGATRFLDLLTTNYVPALAVGRAQYSFVLDLDGRVVDDVLVYRRAPAATGGERYMLVVNAVNAERVHAWLAAASTGEPLLDRERPERALDAHPTVRDLRDPAAGAERLVDLAVQGPRSLEVLLAALGDGDPAFRRALSRLQRFELVEGELAGGPVVVSRTGYTGEPLGFELCVHPERAVALWRRLLEVGQPLGIRPCGLGARDSLRTEAGFPLYGHELAGELGISPLAAGYGSFVKLHKPFFVGRRATIAAEAARRFEVVRFRLVERGVRMARPGDPVVDRRGECVGQVTSCTAVEGQQIGLAYVERAAAAPGTSLGIFPLGGAGARPRPEKSKWELRPGDRVLVPEAATVLARFR